MKVEMIRVIEPRDARGEIPSSVLVPDPNYADKVQHTYYFYKPFPEKTIQFCCILMSDAILVNEIAIELSYPINQTTIPPVHLMTRNYSGDLQDGTDIQYCPFCGEKIELTLVGTYKKVITKTVTKVLKEVDEIHEKTTVEKIE